MVLASRWKCLDRSRNEDWKQDVGSFSEHGGPSSNRRPMKLPTFFNSFIPSLTSSVTSLRCYSVRGRFKITRQAPTNASDRTYKEELYSARRFVNPAPNSASICHSRLSAVMKNEGIVEETKNRRQFIRPSKRRVLALFKTRQGKFNQMFRDTLTKIMSIHESRR